LYLSCDISAGFDLALQPMLAERSYCLKLLTLQVYFTVS